MPSVRSRVQHWARALRTELTALRLAYRDPRTPWAARLVLVLVLAYALSPIDLIPDPIPVLGYLDDLVLLPLGIALALRMLPPEVVADSRAAAAGAAPADRRLARLGAALVVAGWLALAALCAWAWWARRGHGPAAP